MRARLPGAWPHRRSVGTETELDAVLPPSTDALLHGREPIYQRPAPRERSSWRLVAGVLSIALVAFGTLVLLAPIATTNAVAHLVGSR